MTVDYDDLLLRKEEEIRKLESMIRNYEGKNGAFSPDLRVYNSATSSRDRQLMFKMSEQLRTLVTKLPRESSSYIDETLKSYIELPLGNGFANARTTIRIQ